MVLRIPKPVKIFVMGTNKWREEEDWPLARARNTEVFSTFLGKGKFLIGRWQSFRRQFPFRATGDQ